VLVIAGVRPFAVGPIFFRYLYSQPNSAEATRAAGENFNSRFAFSFETPRRRVA